MQSDKSAKWMGGNNSQVKIEDLSPVIVIAFLLGCFDSAAQLSVQQS